MNVRALANFSGAVGERTAGDEFTVDASAAKSLVERGLAEEVKNTPAPKAEKAKE